jgi:DNA-binding response OmpR family regulator
MVVDDEPIAAGALQTLLSAYKHRVKVAENGKHALKLFGKGMYDLVITDFRMPGIDGLKLEELIRKRSPQQAILMITGHPEALPNSGRQLPLGAVLPKPCLLEELRDAFHLIFLGAPRAAERIQDLSATGRLTPAHG